MNPLDRETVRSTADTMDVSKKRTPSGIEPVDALMGGLESGELYLVHGEASAKSLFGIAFLIEGLKRGEQCAFIVRGAPEDAVRRFARLGFDCLEDVYSGRLVILESSRTMSDRVARGGQLAPALRELEWLLGETRPCRLVFDPVTSYVAGAQPLEDRAAEFALWTKSLGGTSLLIASDSDPEITRLLKPDVLESFRFDLREAGNRSTRFLAFEKSLTLSAQAIDVDPSRGIFLAEPVEAATDSPRRLSNPASDSRLLDIDVLPQSQSMKRTIGCEIETNGPQVRRNYTVGRINETEPLELDLESIDNALARLVDKGDEKGKARPQQPLAALPGLGKPGAGEPNAEHELDLTSELFGELAGVIFPGDLTGDPPSPRHECEDPPVASEVTEQAAPRSLRLVPEGRRDSDASPRLDLRQVKTVEPFAGDLVRSQTARRAADLRIDAARAASAVEALLGRSKFSPSSSQPSQLFEPVAQAPVANSVDPKSFKVLVINDESEHCEIIVQSLRDFTIEQTNDGIGGLAGLLSYQPDLVVLDLDLPIVDGFKVLAHVRASLNVPVMIVSSSLAQSGDRARSGELATDSGVEVDQLSKALAASGYYHLTRAFSTKELREKARQLIARYRGIDAWIVASPGRVSESTSSTPSTILPERRQNSGVQEQHQSAVTDWFTPYDDFVAELEKRVKAVMDTGSALSVVGCRVPENESAAREIAEFRLREAIRHIVRDTDLAATHAPNEVVILLADARASGARAFASRLRATVTQKMSQEPSVWMRSFPELEETVEDAASHAKPSNGGLYRRRASDRQARG